MENILAVLVLVILIGSAAIYLVKAKRNGVKCVGCPSGGCCSNVQNKKRKKLEGPVIAKKKLLISGMRCQHCVQTVTDSLNQIEGVSARVDASKGCAEVSLDREVEDDILITAVEKEGFSVASINNTY